MHIGGVVVNRLAVNLTLSALLVHLLLGCCWHHAHACQDNCVCSGAAEARGTDRCCALDSGSCCCQDGPSDQSHPCGHQCRAARCMFLSAAADRESPSSGKALSENPAATGTAGVALLADWKACFQASEEAGPSSSPQRLHLLYQVLLL